MKKHLLFVVLTLMPLVAAAHDIEVKNGDDVTIYYVFTNNNTELEVSFCGKKYSTYSDEYVGNVVIPEEVTYMNSTHKVTSIGASAFRGCTALTSVTLGNNVKSIGSNAFSGCTALTSVTIPASAASIGERAFLGCSGLTSAIITHGVTTIGESAFRGCTGLTGIAIPASVTSIGNEAFAGCSGLSSIIVAPGNTKYDSRFDSNAIIDTENNMLIAGCKNSTIPYGVTSIGWCAFWGCSDLIAIIIPYGVTSIGYEAFARCSGLASVTLPSTLISIGESAFWGCTELTSLVIPKNVTSIEGSAFAACFGLASISVATGNARYDSRGNCNAIIETATNTLIAGCESTVIPSTVTSIAWNAFYRCTGLSTINIPSGVTSIGSGAFYGCVGLSSITVDPENTQYDSRGNCNAIIETKSETLIVGCEKTVIPNTVKAIGWYAFYGCAGLSTITIPDSITTIGSGAFDGIDLTTIVSQIKDPFKIEGRGAYNSPFTPGTFYNATLYVPKGTIEKYKATDGWKDFIHIQESDDPDGVSTTAASPLLLRAANGFITVEGIDDQTDLRVYTIDGKLAGTAVARNNAATVATCLPAGSIAILKIGDRAVKVRME